MEDRVHVLIVDDDEDIRDMVSEYLSNHGCHVSTAEDGVAMEAELALAVPQVVLLDVGLPGEDGLTLARRLRDRYSLGIIIVSAAGETVDRIAGLELGADDYVSKPFDLRELRARTMSVVRRYPREQVAASTAVTGTATCVRVGAMKLHIEAQQLIDCEGKEIPLTSMEYELLKTFVQRPNRVLSRDDLLNLTQNRDWSPYDRSIDIRITRLRRKIEVDANKPVLIRTVRGTGYKFTP